MDLLESLGFGVALGFSLTVPPGPMNALIAGLSARSRRAGTITGFGAMTSDGILAAVVFALSTAVDLRSLVRPIDAIGAVALAYFGLRTLRRPPTDDEVPRDDVRSFSRAVVVGITNPFQVAWWFTAGLAFARLGGAVLLAGLFGAVAIWVVVFPAAVFAGARRYPAARRAIVLLSGAILLAFAVYFAVLAA